MMHFKLTEKELKNANPGTENLILEMVELGYLQQSDYDGTKLGMDWLTQSKQKHNRFSNC